MIDVKELRIGNWIVGITGTYDQVRAADIFTIEMGHDNGLCNPIPLTPEILEACGFKKAKHPALYKDCYSIMYDRIEIIVTDLYFDVYTKYNPTGIDEYYNFISIGELMPKYLHQLQNLYHSLCGKELTYTP